jgi:hypothetical protein
MAVDPIDFLDPFGLWPRGGAAAASSSAQNPASSGGFQILQGGKGAGSFLPRGAARLGLAGVLVALDTLLAYEDYQAIQDFNAENAAYGAEWQSVIAYNQAMLAHPRPLPLAGRYTGKKRRKWNDNDCEIMYQSDTQLCNSLPKPEDRAACHAQAAERYANCLAGRPIPPLPWRLPN